MYNFKRSLIGLSGLLLLIGVVAAVTPFKGYGQQSHEAAEVQDARGVKAKTIQTPNIEALNASDIVTLMSSNIGFRRVTPNGVLGGSEFVVPADQVLIVTDVEWVRTCNSCTGGGTEKIVLEVNGPTNTHRPVFSSVGPVGSNGQSGASEAMRTGFAVAEGGRVTIAPALSSSSSTLTVFLHGYLVPAG